MPSDPARLFSSPWPSVCGIIPARLIWSRSFVSVAAAAARMNQRSFYTWSEALLQLLRLSPFSIYQDMARQIEVWLNPVFPPYPPLSEHTEEHQCIIQIYAKPHTRCSFSQCGETCCLPRNIRCQPIKPPYLMEASFCSPLIWRINLPDYLLSRKSLYKLSLSIACMHNIAKSSYNCQIVRSGWIQGDTLMEPP